jgi:rhodanese-related sulfurtransferase
MKSNSLITDIALLVGIGVVLGAGYNGLGLRGGNDWGVAWKGVPLIETLGDEVQAVEIEALPAGNVSDDPLAPAAVPERAIPVIEDFGRPVEIGLKAAKQLHDAGAALFIDAREDWEYAEGHIPGAINLPYEQAITDPDRLEKIDQGGKPIVTYCGGGSCEISISVAWELLGVGKTHIAVYMGGFPEWAEAGYTVEKVEGP